MYQLPHITWHTNCVSIARRDSYLTAAMRDSYLTAAMRDSYLTAARRDSYLTAARRDSYMTTTTYNYYLVANMHWLSRDASSEIVASYLLHVNWYEIRNSISTPHF